MHIPYCATYIFYTLKESIISTSTSHPKNHTQLLFVITVLNPSSGIKLYFFAIVIILNSINTIQKRISEIFGIARSKNETLPDV